MKINELTEKKVTLEKGLDKKEALVLALKKEPGDYRGFTYDAKTGMATLI